MAHCPILKAKSQKGQKMTKKPFKKSLKSQKKSRKPSKRVKIHQNSPIKLKWPNFVKKCPKWPKIAIMNQKRPAKKWSKMTPK